MPTLLGLPTEVFVSIADDLNSDDFFDFRQVSREINSRTIALFAQRYFKTRYVMLERNSLENLIDVSHHSVFGPALESLEIGIHHLRDRPDDFDRVLWSDFIGFGESSVGDERSDEGVQEYLTLGVEKSSMQEEAPAVNRESTMEEEAPAVNQESTMEEEALAMNQQEYDRHLEDQRYMIESGLDTTYLTQALTALPNYKAIIFTNDGWP